MSGRCFSCASQFGFLKKEHGCPSCGFAFCKDCLKKKIAVPKRNQEIHKVCNKCYNVLSGATTATNTVRHSPPEALKKRLAALEGKEVPSTVPSDGRQNQATGQKYRGMSKEDIVLQQRLDNLRKERQKDIPPTPNEKEIESRLNKLKDKGKPPPSDKEMAQRLAVLKGQDPSAVNQTTPSVCKPIVQKSQQQQIDDLLEEICDEVNIDSQTAASANNRPNIIPNLQGKSSVENPKEGKEVDLEDVNKLMKEVAAEMELDAQKAIQGLKQDTELMERLNQLKKDRNNSDSRGEKDIVNKSSESPDEDSENEEQAMKKVIKQAFEECQLDNELAESGLKAGPSTSSQKTSVKTKKIATPVETEDSDPDEFPWCCICNEDATLRCLGCDYDLYCHRCFKEGHEQLDMPDHRTVPFKQSKK